ncbi:putative ovule protein [Cocos nucifera]|nr:putative ovule protein [Cocos nucifera]
MGAVGHDGTKMPSSFHPYPSMDYMQFSIRGIVGAYSIHLSIDCSGTSTVGIYSTDGASFSWTFHGPIRMAHVWNCLHQVMVYYDSEERSVGETAQEMHSFFGVLVGQSDIISIEPRDWRLMDATIRNRVWEDIWRMYDFSDHERAQDARLKKIEELY